MSETRTIEGVVVSDRRFSSPNRDLGGLLLEFTDTEASEAFRGVGYLALQPGLRVRAYVDESGEIAELRITLKEEQFIPEEGVVDHKLTNANEAT